MRPAYASYEPGWETIAWTMASEISSFCTKFYEHHAANQHAQWSNKLEAYLEYRHCGTSQLHTLFGSTLPIDDAVVLPMKDELYQRIQRRRRFKSIPLFAVCIRDRDIGRDY